MNRIIRAAAAVLALVVIAAPAANARPASAYLAVLRAYEKWGKVPACAFSSQELNTALKGVDVYQAQYEADFTDAINQALTAQGAGVCDKTPAGSAVTPTAGSGTLPGGSVPAPTGSGVPAPILILAVLGALLALATAFVGVWRRRGWDPRWAAAIRHSWGEAGYRAGGTWGEFVDWWRSAPRGR
jgi:hypothetical protein